MQAKGSTALDASSLLMPLVKFIAPTDPRWVSTLRAIERDLVSDSLVYRYRIGDRVLRRARRATRARSACARSGTSSACRGSASSSRRASVFEKMLGYANHLGLYGEELGRRGEHLGNFPQAFTHLALISAAYDLDRRLSVAGHSA